MQGVSLPKLIHLHLLVEEFCRKIEDSELVLPKLDFTNVLNLHVLLICCIGCSVEMSIIEIGQAYDHGAMSCRMSETFNSKLT